MAASAAGASEAAGAAAASASAAAPPLVASFARRSRPDFLAAVQEALGRSYFPGARQELRRAAEIAGDGFGLFALHALLDLLAPGQPKNPQVVALLSELGPAGSGGGGGGAAAAAPLPLGDEGEECVLRLAGLGGQLKAVVRVLEAWQALEPAALGPELRAGLAAAALREARAEGGAGVAAAAAALGALPWLLDEAGRREVVEAVDDGSRDDVGEKLAAALPRETRLFLVERRRAMGRLKATARAVTALGLQEEFPDADFQYRAASLQSALKHGSRQAAVGLCFDEPRLHEACVRGLLSIGEATLGLELAGAWDIPLTAAEEAAAAARVAEVASAGGYLALPAGFGGVTVVDSEAAAVAMREVLLSSPVVGLDTECLPSARAAADSNGACGAAGGAARCQLQLLQLATSEAAFLVDLPALAPSGALAEALQALFSSPAVVKAGFDVSQDIAKIGKAFPSLAKACCKPCPLVDVQDLEADRRAKQQGLSKRRAREGLGLSSLAEQYLGKPLDKSLQVCDWSRRPLSEAQRRYATLDAWAPAKIYAEHFS